jgi:uncharacterized protein with PQ loop repeat
MNINESPAAVVTKQFRDKLNENVPFQFQIMTTTGTGYWMVYVYVIKNIHHMYIKKCIETKHF